MKTSMVCLRLPDDLMARVDAACGPRGRSGWFRAAAEARLSGGEVPVSEPVQAPTRKRTLKLGKDAGLLLKALQGGRRSSDNLRLGLGWERDRYEKAEATLVRDGRILVLNGMVEAL